jgi:TM2 domain-containing membrane protein YozV
MQALLESEVELESLFVAYVLLCIHIYIHTYIHMQALLESEVELKSLFVAYLLLFIGGFFGLHHYYLGRRHDAKLYLLSFGMCGVGVFMDICRLPALVEEANDELIRADMGTFECMMILREWSMGVFVCMMI